MLWDFKDHLINSLIIKTSECCNLNCDYCYIDNTNKIKTIDIKIIEKTIIKYIEYIKSKRLKSSYLYIVWHGGEPLTCGIQFYKKIVNLEKKILLNYKGFKIFNSIQTNGTLINKEYAEFFKLNNFGIGVSIDGPKAFHDIHRKDTKGKGTFDKIAENLKILKSYNIKYSAICVIGKESLSHENEYYEVFKDLGVSEVDFIPTFYQEGKYNLSKEEYMNFLITLYNLYKNDQNKKFNIRVFDDILRSLISENIEIKCSIGCEFAGRCGENFSILANGNVYPCDCLVNYQQLCLGNILENSFLELLNNQKFKNFQNNVNIIPQKCLICDVKKICKAGCFNRRITKKEVFNNFDLNEDYYCEARKGLIKYVLLSI